ncbi:peptidase M6 [Bacillus pseudomycoides]|uniref:Peptidase M6 n=1 Tax=Bacillus pseudomycoides TaxID=64104 RepID=A0AA91V866_9BACI|nr:MULTISPECIES: immune inhibitor A [Bacillus]PEB53726.1 peptidase M6 [Bacillus sp. AFS098217]PED80332.1 peptidase M6 [Bacillus pseudomycoides]PEU10572.1 peptidase M6 [Bacillus sp. AFS019443]PEU19952.1 peptidase M6 [Bacillus sp. AFS014408]PFW59587.1 peptidase M6 [Bacillus sp. AFS075034]
MKRKTPFKVLSSLAITTMLGCTFVFSASSTYAETPSQSKGEISTTSIDNNLIQEDRLAEALKERGTIDPSASKEETKKAVEQYIEKKKGDQPNKEIFPGDPAKEASDFVKKVKETKMEEKEKVKKPAKNVNAEQTPELNKKQLNGKVPTFPAKQAPYNGAVRTDKVLVLLVEFSDYKHNNIEQTPGYMYSKDFSREHYQNMLFGNEPFTLFDGSKVKTFKQYYEEQSGGSYTTDGYVTEWLTVPGKAADYGADGTSGHDNKGPKGPRDLVKEALKAAAEKGIDLSQFDQFDRYDANGNGNKNEPDGVIDHLMVIHAGVGQEAGGGKLGDDAIWSHRSKLAKDPVAIEGTKSKVSYWDGKVAAHDYTIEPEDGAVGVFAHEFGHDLGLPDEYDTNYTGTGSPVEAWSLMSGGSWTGKIAGTEPTSFSPQNKDFLQKNMGGNWAKIVEVDYDKIKRGVGFPTYIDQSVTKSNRPGLVRVNLPGKSIETIKPEFGKHAYYSTRGDDIHTTLETRLFDLTKAVNAKFDYKANYELEANCDFIEVHAVTEDGTKTLIDKLGDKVVKGDQDTTEGKWIDKSYDLSQFKGKKVKLQFDYITDPALTYKGFAMDNVNVTVDGKTVFSDDAEGQGKMNLKGFVVSDGTEKKQHYYYLEWRNYAGSDMGLKASKGPVYNTGLVVWYADDSFKDNWVGEHPGEGFLGVVDSHPEAVVGNLSGKPVFGTTGLQIADAAFSFDQTPAWNVNSLTRGQFNYPGLQGVTTFDDSKVYSNSQIPDAGRKVPQLGLKFQVVGQADDKSAGAVWIHR